MQSLRIYRLAAGRIEAADPQNHPLSVFGACVVANDEFRRGTVKASTSESATFSRASMSIFFIARDEDSSQVLCCSTLAWASGTDDRRADTLVAQRSRRTGWKDGSSRVSSSAMWHSQYRSSDCLSDPRVAHFRHGSLFHRDHTPSMNRKTCP